MYLAVGRKRRVSDSSESWCIAGLFVTWISSSQFVNWYSIDGRNTMHAAAMMRNNPIRVDAVIVFFIGIGILGKAIDRYRQNTPTLNSIRYKPMADKD